ncbi:MAG: amidophosphoribosyltransferase [Bacteroides sp. SM1_62]|nr:MAG: amidophosphoribosyltransferase [Bacteroides sp. SM1_62]
MSEQIKHECGIALIRLLKPLEYYQYKYGTWRYGLNKLYLLMEKQHNRGQDGAGVACVNFDLPPGKKYISRYRSADNAAINDVFGKISADFKKPERKKPERFKDAIWAKENLPFTGELYMGHLRYGTYGKNKLDNVHPVMRENNWKSRNLVLAGNFNLTNVEEQFHKLIELGQHPKDFSDTVTILEKIGHFLDQENQRLFDEFKDAGHSNIEISGLIADHLDVANILSEASKQWDGGYMIGGLLGHGDAFVYRDPWGIRPGFYYKDDEIVVAASERPVIQTVMNVPADRVHEIDPGHAVIIKKNGKVSLDQIRTPQEKKSCSFERIYFSRGSDRDIYRERKKLGRLLTPDILKAIDYDVDNTVFSFIPNTAESAFYGMIRGVENHMNEEKARLLLKGNGKLDEEKIDQIICHRPRVEKIAVKDIKLRTFISQDEGRDDLVGHVYDITYGTIRKGQDNLVVIDDSIVRGTTLRRSILKILDRLEPKKIIVVSSSPQIRYPDCYGIDMAKLGDFVAFQAAIALLKETGRESVINEVYNRSVEQVGKPKEEVINYVKMIYEPFTYEQVSGKVGELLKSKDVSAEVRIVYQTVENLHLACPDHLGDWYFTGDYPTPGGNKVVNTSFINYINGRNQRAY